MNYYSTFRRDKLFDPYKNLDETVVDGERGSPAGSPDRHRYPQPRLLLLRLTWTPWFMLSTSPFWFFVLENAHFPVFCFSVCLSSSISSLQVNTYRTVCLHSKCSFERYPVLTAVFLTSLDHSHRAQPATSINLSLTILPFSLPDHILLYWAV